MSKDIKNNKKRVFFKKAKEVLISGWWQRPFFNTILSSILTAVIFVLLLPFYNHYFERTKMIRLVESELLANYWSINEHQTILNVDLTNSDGLIQALRKENPSYTDKSDKEVFIDFWKNRPADESIITDNWDEYQSELTGEPEKYEVLRNIYASLKRLKKFSQIKSGTIKSNNPAELAIINSQGGIKLNSEEFLNKFKKHYPDLIIKK